MTNVNSGNRDPRNGRFSGARKFFSRDKSEDLLQDRGDLADDLMQEPASDHYETAGDGSFDEALDEYYDARDQYDPREERAAREAAERKTTERETVAREPVARGKHHRREEVDSDDYGYSGGYKTDSDGYGYSGGYKSDSDGYGYTYGHREAAGSTAAIMGAEIGDYVDGDNNYGYTSKEAAYDDRADYDNYDDERTDSIEADRADRAEDADRAAAAPVTRTAAAGAGSSTAAAAGGVPKRGLAMILIAVGLLLALWAVYALTKGGADNQAANDPAGQSVQNQNDPNAQGQNGAGQNPNDPNAQNPNGAGQNGAGQNPNDPNAQNQNGADQNGASQNRQPGAAADAQAGPNNPMTRENMTVNIYNNSAMSNLAERVSGQARENGFNLGEVGNIPGENAIFEQNTVLFDPNTPGAEDRARELADTIGGIALANDDRVPAEAKKPGSVTVVLAENREVAL